MRAHRSRMGRQAMAFEISYQPPPGIAYLAFWTGIPDCEVLPWLTPNAVALRILADPDMSGREVRQSETRCCCSDSSDHCCSDSQSRSCLDCCCSMNRRATRAAISDTHTAPLRLRIDRCNSTVCPCEACACQARTRCRATSLLSRPALTSRSNPRSRRENLRPLEGSRRR